MLSKGSPATLPIILLGLAWWRRGRITRFDIWRSVPFFIVAIVMVLMNVWSMQRVVGGETIRSGFAERLAGAGTAVWFYFSKALLPINLVFVYPMWHIQIGNLLWWLPLLVAVS